MTGEVQVVESTAIRPTSHGRPLPRPEGRPEGGSAGAGIRAATFGACAMLLTALAHAAGGGHLPGVGPVLLLALLSAGLTSLLAWLRAGWWLVAATTTGGQFLAHEFLNRWTAWATSCSPGGGTVAHDPGYDPFALGPDGRPVAGAAITGLDLEMFGWHLGCAALLLVTLRYGESAMRVAVRFASRTLRRIRLRAVDAPTAAPRSVTGTWRPPALSAAAPDTGGPGRRGPPRLLPA